MSTFEVEIKGGAWNIKKLINFLHQIKEDMKCSHEQDCNEKATLINIENGNVVWSKHYDEAVDDDVTMKSKFNTINIDFDECEKSFKEFEVNFVQTKAAVSLLKVNKLKLKDMKKLVDKICEDEKKLDLHVSKIMESTLGAKSNERYLILLKVMEELEFSQALSLDMIKQCKSTSLSSMFTDLFSQIKEICISSIEQSLDQNAISNSNHQILNKKLKILESDTKSDAKESKEEMKVSKNQTKVR